FQDFPNPFLLQGFEYYVVIDFEATCDKERNLHPQGIIEFPSVVVSGVTGDIIACFQTYVRPTFDPLLTDFCKELTGIQQHQVDNGVTLGEALYFHDKWLLQMGLSNTNFSVVAWSDWDCQVMLESECRIKKIQKPAYFNRWINLRVPISKAVELVWHGRAHWGLDDSINMARFLAVIMQRGFKFSITKSLTPPQAITQDSPITSNRHHQFLVLQRMCTFQHTSRNPAEVEEFRCCFCGAKSFKKIIRKPGPKCGSFFFGYGNLTPNKGASCNYFHSATA
ncbi:hypothetical protein CICLE_v10027071mg, partial [Citrus x clementina]